jgi:N6-adenosine-specific RNA methylase IME4
MTRDEIRGVPMPYKTMAVAEIAALPVGDFAEPDAHLYLWTTQRYLRDSFDIAEAWGFKVATTLVWCKKPFGLKVGGTFPSSVEFIQFCRRGNLPALARADKQWWDWPRRIAAPVGRGERRSALHSAKPEAFLDIVEQVSPGPYLEVFARRARFGWEYAGDGSLGTVAIPGLRTPDEAVAA